MPIDLLPKLNKGILGPVWKYWCWNLGKPLLQFKPTKIYKALLVYTLIELVLNQIWGVNCTFKEWKHQLSKIWHFKVSAQLKVFAYTRIFQGLACKARLSKLNITTSRYVACEEEETIKHIFRDCYIIESIW